MEDKDVYVIYDPLYERVVCVHDEPDKECEICEPIQKEREIYDPIGTYYLEEHIRNRKIMEKKYLIQTKLK